MYIYIYATHALTRYVCVYFLTYAYFFFSPPFP